MLFTKLKEILAEENRTPKSVMFGFGLALLSLLFAGYPLVIMFGATNLNIISLFEFYFIDIMIYDLNKSVNDTKLTDIIPFKDRLFGFGLLNYLLPERVLEFLEPVLNFISVYSERIDAVLGGACLFALNEFLGLLGYVYSPFKMLLIVPLVIAVVASPVNVVYLPFTVMAFLATFTTVVVTSLILSVLINRPLYQYLRLESILYSIAFATLTDMAYLCLQTTLACTFGYVLYALTLLPLLYFISRAYNARLEPEQGVFVYFCYMVGSMALVLHVVEAAYTILGAMGYKRCKVIANVLHSEPVQASLLSFTTGLSALNIYNQLADESNQVVSLAA